jgi:folate-dependent phosphoribosylglycinamide formyltransferase PurN
MIISSKRFDSKHGTFWQQTLKSFQRYGVRLTLWFGFDLIGVPIVAHVARVVSQFTGRLPDLATLPGLAARYGARLVEAADVNDSSILAAVAEYAPDLVVVMNFDQILRKELIAIPRLGTLNVHPSLLPELRGPCPVIWALAQGRSKSGASIHLIENEAIDAGRLLAQAEIPIEATFSVAHTNMSLFLAGARHLRRTIDLFVADSKIGRPQSAGQASYLGFPTREDMAAFKATGRRLCRLSDVLWLLLAALGLSTWTFEG